MADLTNEDEFDAWYDQVIDEAEKKNLHLMETYKISKFKRYDIDFDLGLIKWSNWRGVKLIADIVPIGSYVAEKSNFQWGWAHPKLNAQLKQTAEVLKQLYDKTELNIFQMPQFEATPEMVYGTVAMSVDHLDAQGFYRAPQSGVDIYVALNNVRKA